MFLLPLVLSSWTEQLGLYENDLTGSIPTEMAALTKLGRWRYLILSSYALSPLATPLNSLFILSPLPLAFHSSEELRLYSNGLTGSIASELGVLVNLSTFRLTEKSFHYTTQDCFTHSLCPLSLENLYLYDNVLSGKIPVEIAALTSLGESSINTTVDFSFDGCASFSPCCICCHTLHLRFHHKQSRCVFITISWRA